MNHSQLPETAIVYIEAQLKSVLRLGSDIALDAQAEFSQYGMSSIVSARFCYLLSQDLGVEIAPSALLANYTLEKLTRYVTADLKVGDLPWSALAERAREGRGDDPFVAATQLRQAAPPPKADVAEPAARAEMDATVPEKQALIGRILRELNERARKSDTVDFSFIFFASTQNRQFENKYDYVLNIARFADANGFKALWVPERHFFEFGGIFPNPAMLLSHIASQTSNIRLRSGSVVLPLHHPTAVVEAWSMLDNLSQGRVDMAFASGWNPNDFVSSPHTYANLRDTWFQRMAEVERLWRGEAVEYPNGKREPVAIKVFPRPVQNRLNVWMAISGNEQSFIEAGKRGYNILTMLMSKTAEELGANIERYRRARQEAGFDPATGVVTLMLHTYVHEDAAKVEKCVSEHYFDYIKSGLKGHMQAMPQKPTEGEIDAIVEHSYHFQRKHSALFGNVEHCQSVVRRMHKVGVNEIACLVDFGISEAQMYETLPFISELQSRVNHRRAPAALEIKALPEVKPVAPQVARAEAGGRTGEFAIVGLAGRYPAASSVESFWRNLVQRRNCITEITGERYDWRTIHGDPKTEAGKTNIRHFGLMDDVYDFDAAFFRISNREGEMMDPHARLLLQAVWQSIENAGIRPATLHGSRTGVFVAFYNNEYGQLLDGVRLEKSSEPYLGTALSGTIKANRISFLLGLTGPSEVYDTACSSSLVALHRAMQSIAAGDCEQAIVCGVSLLLSPSRVVALSKMGILNESNVCNPYSYPANREVIGEGVGAMMIKPLAAAEADGDPIYAVVCGSDVSHQGNSSGHLTMPSAKALSSLLDGTYDKLKLDRSKVSYVEGHGSGNDSDVVELMALNSSFAKLPPGKRIPIGSVKSNIGFGEASGGMAQLTKCALSLHHGLVPATLNFTRCDPAFDLAASNVRVLDEHLHLSADEDHYLSVLAYGLGGTNAHIVMRNYRGSSARGAASGRGTPQVLLFSAGSSAALTAYLQEMLAYLDDNADRASEIRHAGVGDGQWLSSLAYTLMARERHAPVRVAFIESSPAQLRSSIEQYLGAPGAQASAGIVLPTSAGVASPPALSPVEDAVQGLRALASRWVNGADVDWQSAFVNGPCSRLALPTVPFSGQTLRLMPSKKETTPPAAPAVNRLHWAKSATGTEVRVEIFAHDYFVSEHRVDGTPLLPAVAYLSILREIARRVFGQERCVVRNIAWLMPFDLAGAPSATLQFSFDPRGQFRAMHAQRNLLCCKGLLDIHASGEAATAAHARATFPGSDVSHRKSLLTREEYWSLANGEQAKQLHGERMRSLMGLYQQNDVCVAELGVANDGRPFADIPLFDGALGATLGLALLNKEQLAPSVPFSIDTFQVVADGRLREARSISAVVRRRAGNLPKYDIELQCERGELVAEFSGFFAKTFEQLPTATRAHDFVVPAAARAIPPRQQSQSRDLRQRLVDTIHGRIATFLKADPDEVPVDEGLESLGLDSIGVNEITEQLCQVLGFELPATLMFEYPNIDAMAGYLLAEFPQHISAALEGASAPTATVAAPAAADSAGEQPPWMGADAPTTATHRRTTEPVARMAAPQPSGGVGKHDTMNSDVAVIGIGGMYPGSMNTQEFWNKLKAGHDFIGDLPPARREAMNALFPDSMAQLPGLQGGFVEAAERFDAAFFGVSEEEALAMDPQQRLFLVACWQAIEDAGYYPHSLNGKNIGVYVGAIANEYLQTITLAGFTSAHLGTGGALSGIANRSSYFFDLHGPSQTIDVACCSSLYAVDRAVQDIRAGACEAALVGGVNYIGVPHGFVAYAAMNYLAKDWRCKAFAAGGDGWSKGEMFAAVYLKSHARAVADGDAIYAVITGSGINHGGRSHFYEQPNSGRHAELISRVYREGRVDPARLVHIEAHGTGTEMGDALEFNVMQRSLNAFAAEQGVSLGASSCALGSVKSNIGHTEAASGIAGFIKTVLLVHDRVIPPSLHIVAANKHLRLENSPLYLADRKRDLRPEAADGRIYASVHSFNFSGAAAHVVVAEAQDVAVGTTLNLKRYPVCISAPSVASLREYLSALASHVEQHPDESLDRLVYTLNVSRSYFTHRVAIVVESPLDLASQLRRALKEFEQLQGHRAVGSIRYSDAPKHTKKVSHYPALSEQNVDVLVAQWLEQAKFSWAAVLESFSVTRLHLPSFPFTDGKLCFAISGTVLQGASAGADTPVGGKQQEPMTQVESTLIAAAPVAAPAASPDSAPRDSVRRPGKDQTREFVRTTIAELFSLKATDIDLGDKISAYPFESLTLVTLCELVNRTFGLQSSPPDYFAFVTLSDIATFIDDAASQAARARKPAQDSGQPPLPSQSQSQPQPQLQSQAKPPLAPAYKGTASANSPAPARDAIAIIGMSGAFPGAPDLHSFWQVLSEGRDCISEIPASRWDWRAALGEASNGQSQGAMQWGGFIDQMEQFDPQFFEISPREAEMMDPQQRLLLTHVWQAIEDAGYAPSQLAGSNTAVFFGLGSSGFEQVLDAAKIPVGGHAATGLSPCIAPNRVSFILDLHGPSEAVDTACSSSLIALHRVVKCLRNGESDLAIAGGVNIIISSVVHASLNNAGMLAEDGRCKTFGASANGYVRGEGIAVLLLKRLVDAERDGDHIHGVILGSAENHGGRANSLTAPNPNAQSQLLISAFRDAGVTPDTVTYIEAHGTGTKLGDPIEINGLKGAFETLQQTNGVDIPAASCALGSVKTNIGHLEYAAGVAGVVKVLLQMRFRQLAKSLHAETINPYLALEGSPFSVVQEARPWTARRGADGRDLPRRAGVSSLGFGGANAHVVLEEYAENEALASTDGDVPAVSRIFVLSAKSEEQLRLQAGRLLERVERGDYRERDLPRIAFTLQVGRDAYEHRLAFEAETLTSLQTTLRAIAQDGKCSTPVFRGKRTDGRESLDVFEADAGFQQLANKWLSEGNASKLLKLWVRGFNFDWAFLYGGGPKGRTATLPRRISLPTYPFKRNVYWPKAARAIVANTATAAVVPAARVVTLAPYTASPAAPESKSQPPVQTPAIHAKPRVILQNLTPGAASVAVSPIPRQSVPFAAIADSGKAMGAESVPNVAGAPNVASTGAVAQDTAISVPEVLASLKKGLSAALYIDIAELDVDKTFSELGLDSVLAVEWVRGINQQMRIEMPVAKLYDHPTLVLLAQFVHSLLSEAVTASALPVAAETDRTESSPPAAQREPEVAPVSDAAPSPTPMTAPATVESAAPDVAEVTHMLRNSLATSLYLEPSEIPSNKPFVELGLDSVIAVEWMRHLNQVFGINLPVIKLYDFPTIDALAEHVVAERQSSNVSTVVATPAFTPVAPPAPMTAIGKVEAPHGPRGLVIGGVRKLDELQLQSWVVPAPRAGEVTIDVRASAVNFPDSLCVNGLYPTMPAYPFVPGFEVAGVISAVGYGVEGVAVGDAVIALTGEQLGGHAQQVNVSGQGLIPKPANISFEEACCMPVAFGTVYSAFALGNLREKEHVLIQTATGGCGLMALQLARLLGCVCYGTSSRAEKREILERLEVPHVFNYQEDFDQELRQITHGRGVDVVLNMVAGEAMQKGLDSLAPGGRYLELAVHALKARAKFDLSRLIDNQSFLSMDFRRLAMSGGGRSIASAFDEMVRLIENEQIVPIVSRVYPFSQVKDALAFVSKGAHIGKVVVSHQAERMIDYSEQCIERMRVQLQTALRRPLIDPMLRLHREAADADALVAAQRPVAPMQTVKKPGRAAGDVGIAVIGMAGQFPQAPDLSTFWRNIAEGRDCISEVPTARWAAGDFFDTDRTAPGKSYCKWMGVLDDADKFDPLFFSISPAEAKAMDPQQRLFLQACWHCIEDAGINPETLSGSRCGVFAGCTQGMYGQGDDDLDAQGLMGGNSAILAARISYFLNLKGPSIAIDTACSSSLVAINEACNHLLLGKVDLALAGGVTVLSGPGLHIMTSKAGMLSPRGRCFTFDNQADGFVPGEGVGVVLLKNLARALEDGDPIHGVIRGWGVNQDGKTNGITAPSPASQVLLQRQVYEDFGLSPDTITLIEAHGTGTKLGDPIEVSALIESFRASTTRQHYCALGSVKSNIGHTLSAAGVAGVIKTLLALKHRQWPPAVQFRQINEHIPLTGSPFVIHTELRPWRLSEGMVRRAAVSSFSFSGTNAHLVIDEPPQPRTPVPAQPVCLIVLSARSAPQLRAQAEQLVEHVARQGVSLASASYTLLTGRKHFAHRLALIVSSEEELLASLREWLASGRSLNVVSGRSSNAEIRNVQAPPLSSIEPMDHRGHLRYLGERFCLGEILHPAQAFSAALATQRPQRATLPGYPFAKERYWIGQGKAAVAPAAAPPVAVTQASSLAKAALEPAVKPAAHKWQWMFFADQPVLEPLADSIDWRNALRKANSQNLLIVADAEVGDALTKLLAQLGRSLEDVQGAKTGTVRTVSHEEFSLEILPVIPDTVIVYGPTGPRAAASEYREQDIRRVFEVCRAFMRKAWDSRIHFFYVYADDDANPALECEALSGLLSSAAMENRHHRWTLVACDSSDDSKRCNQIILREWLGGLEMDSAQPFTEVRHRGAERWTTRLRSVDFVPGSQSVFRVRATYLITGGLGPMGMLVCTELARRYQSRLVILSRSALNEEQREKIRTIESLGGTVDYFPVDITDPAALKATFSAVKNAVGDIHGVMLLANQVQDGIIANKTWETFAQETATKTRGTLSVDELTANEPLDFFLLFSSVAAFGLPGSSGYSYSSAFQNAFARHRNGLRRARRRSGFALSCCWGPWTVDYYLRQGNGRERSKKILAQGTDLISIEAAFPLLQSSDLAGRDAIGLVAVRDAARFGSLLSLERPDAPQPPTAAAQSDEFTWFIAHLERWEAAQQRGTRLSSTMVEEAISLEQIRTLPPALIQRLYKLLQADEPQSGPAPAPVARATRVPSEIVAAVAEALTSVLELQSLDHDESFQNYGMDSIVAMKLVTRLERQLHMSIEPKWLIDHPNVNSLSAFLATQDTASATN